MVDWANLLDDLLMLIKEKSSIFLPDFYRFASVCRKWHSIALEKQPPAIPPLLLLPFDEETSTCSLFDICSNNVIKIQMPGLHDRVVCSTSHGWLSTLDSEFDIRLVNLYTQSEILLPRHPRFQELFLEAGGGEEEPNCRRALYASKFVLSASPAVSPQNCFVAGIFGLSLELAICKLGDDKWTRISDMGVAPCSDAIFCGNKIYAVNCNYTEIFVCNLGSEPGMDPQFTLLPVPKKDEGVPGEDYVYLAESSGDLFCILRYILIPEDGDYRTWKFAVFKLDRGNITDSEWHKVDSLDDRVLFLGRNHSFMISPAAASELREFKRNCIYFTEDYLEGYLQRLEGNCGIPGCYDGGVFSLKDETIESCYPSAHPWPAPPIWLEQRF